jgi:hypothetical protein
MLHQELDYRERALDFTKNVALFKVLELIVSRLDRIAQAIRPEKPDVFERRAQFRAENFDDLLRQLEAEIFQESYLPDFAIKQRQRELDRIERAKKERAEAEEKLRRVKAFSEEDPTS